MRAVLPKFVSNDGEKIRTQGYRVVRYSNLKAHVYAMSISRHASYTAVIQKAVKSQLKGALHIEYGA